MVADPRGRLRRIRLIAYFAVVAIAVAVLLWPTGPGPDPARDAAIRQAMAHLQEAWRRHYLAEREFADSIAELPIEINDREFVERLVYHLPDGDTPQGAVLFSYEEDGRRYEMRGDGKLEVEDLSGD